jgi:EmrB/QacA subfamily drug resistance transporter
MTSHVKPGSYHHGDLRRVLEEAALALVAERGPQGFTLAETSRRAGVSVAAPYKHFADREALLASLATRCLREQHRSFTAAMAVSDDPAEQLAAFAAAYVRFAADETALFDIGFCSDVDKSRHPELAAAGQALHDTLMPVTRQLTAGEDDAFDLPTGSPSCTGRTCSAPPPRPSRRPRPGRPGRHATSSPASRNALPARACPAGRGQSAAGRDSGRSGTAAGVGQRPGWDSGRGGARHRGVLSHTGGRRRLVCDTHDVRTAAGGRPGLRGDKENVMSAHDAVPADVPAGPGPAAAGTPAGTSPAGAGADPRRWWILGVIAVAQLMVVLDLTVMNLALPSAQRALGFSSTDRQWVVTAYALSFGSLLLFCGRLADLVGRKVTFLTGLAGFAAASAVGGAAVNFPMLVTARACQGVFAALLAPSALSLLATTFKDPKERARAFGVYGAVAAAGGGLGLLLGGALTTYLSWRWCMYITAGCAAVAIAGGALLVGRQQRTPGGRLDVPGVVAVSGGMFCLVYGFSNAASHTWHTPSTWGFLAGGVALLAAFAGWQSRAPQPLLPPRVVLDRSRGGAYLTVLTIGAATFGVFLFLIYYMQVSLGYSAVRSGVAMLPMVTFSGLMATLGNTRLLPRFGPRPMVAAGMLLDAGGMVWLTRIGTHSQYASELLGPLAMVGAGSGLIFGMVAATGTFGVAPYDAGVASASINTGQQLGGSIGTALLNTIAASSAADYVSGHTHGRPAPGVLQAAAVHSYTTVFWWCAGIYLAGAVICGALLRPGPLAPRQDDAAPRKRAPHPAPARP